MSAEENKVVIRRLIKEVYNEEEDVKECPATTRLLGFCQNSATQ